MPFRVGFGYDVHPLASGRDMILGGVQIPYNKGMVAHSDGDVLVHAICDALLGAANLRDIGSHFPDTSAEFKGISSLILLKRTMQLLLDHGYRVGNVDCTVCLQQPKIKDYIPQMASLLAECMDTDASGISIKATTTEKMGFVGREEGISAYAVALITRGS
jgi:2-C-methyl-D-erythritol 2,4-cyclodiphosphate synthase